MKRANKQKGFTIIELVVVILLLGILTATALPRFMDVTDEAHDAVVQGVIGGLNTGAAMFRAAWYATGQPNTVVSGDYNMPANSVGYPIGVSTVTVKNNADCVAIFNGLLQAGGRPTIAAATATSASILGSDTSVSTTTFVAKQDGTGDCEYAYTGQFRLSTAGDIPILEYDSSTGTIVLGTPL